MADVKVPALLHKMSKAAQKAWYKKNNMAMPDDAGGKSAAAAKKVKVAPRKTVAIDPTSVRAVNAARQQAYMAKGGRQPIGAAGSGGHSSMAGSNMSTAKGMIAGIKAGFNPKVSLDPYESEKAKKVGPRSLKMKKEEVELDEANMRFDYEAAARPKSSDVKNFLNRDKNPRAAAASKKYIRRMTKLGGLGLNQTKKDTEAHMKAHFEEVEQIEEVTKKEAESMLGGPVKEKPKMPPGKQPAGYRYVRGLARKAMKKGMMPEAVMDQADVGEYDYEGDMAKSQLRSILANAKRMHDMLEENTNLPEWVQSKITLAEDYILTAANYMEGEMNEELIRQEESIFEAMKKMEMDDEEDEMDDEDEMEDDEEETEMNGKKKKMEEGYMGFKKLKASIAAKGSARDPAAAGKKLGEEVEQIDEIKAVKAYDKEGKLVGRYRSMDHAKQMKPGHTYKVEEEVVTEAEGKVAVTPQEKTLAAHHGDKTKITYGDVIKARIKSAKEKALKGKE